MPLNKDSVKLKITGNVSMIQYMKNQNSQARIRKINKHEYVDLSTGELKKIIHAETRADDFQSVRKTMVRARDIINCNLTNPSHGKFITITYAENMTDTKRLYLDMDKFMKKLKYHFGLFGRVTAIEPQGRGAWHAHVILIFDKKSPFMDNKIIQPLWGHGITYVQNLDDVDNVGAYLTAYLTDIPYDDGMLLTLDGEYGPMSGDLEVIEKKGKKYVKGARMILYPAGMQIFRYSKGLKKPKEEKMKYCEAKEKVSSAKLTFSNTIKLDSDDYSNIIHKEFYNSARK